MKKKDIYVARLLLEADGEDQVGTVVELKYDDLSDAGKTKILTALDRVDPLLNIMKDKKSLIAVETALSGEDKIVLATIDVQEIRSSIQV